MSEEEILKHINVKELVKKTTLREHSIEWIGKLTEKEYVDFLKTIEKEYLKENPQGIDKYFNTYNYNAHLNMYILYDNIKGNSKMFYKIKAWK